MVRTSIKLLIAASTLAISGQAFAQSSDSEVTDVSVTIIQPIVLTPVTDLLFGRVAKGTTGTNTITVAAADGARAVGGGGNAQLAAGTSGRATYTLTGEADATFSIAITDTTIDLDGPGSSTLGVTIVPSAASGTLTSGAASFGVGGNFTIDNDPTTGTAAGEYLGTFEVTVAYN
jgi:hypothetical protein